MKTKGFTLIELAIVVAIVGILAAIAVPIFSSFSDAAKIDELQSNMLVAATAQEEYFISKGKYSSTPADLIAYGFPKNSDDMRFRTGIILKNGVGMSYWINGLRKIKGETHCWLYVSSLMGTTEKASFKELKASEQPYTGVSCTW
ncbi:prepilin-type N-terminal cleavage/methylation domain-containing protein [bacterium]|nr:prepilin-type N-terminal cleavage/methylation domain-containing protein [bacterium]